MEKLDEFNERKSQQYQNRYNSRLNNIECPVCGAELYDTNPGIILTCSPPKVEIHCEKCKYTGYRIY